MSPTTALFRKESRQHGALAVVMVILCLTIQCHLFVGGKIPSVAFPSDAEYYLWIAVFVAALYAGAAAALAYSNEHDNNTFLFLRKMPISTLTLALGKAGWVLCGTAIVLLGNLLLAGCWTLFLEGIPLWNVPNVKTIAYTYGIGIIEVMIWGLFWTTRCRSQIHALLATYLSASATVTFFTNILNDVGMDAATAAVNVLPYRLAAAGIVACFALYGMLRWFDFENKGSELDRVKRILCELCAFVVKEELTTKHTKDTKREHREGFFTIRKVHSPFVALIYQHLRHVSLLYYFGIACFIVWSIGACWLACLPDDQTRNALTGTWWWGITDFICSGGIVCFWGTIFGHDQRGDSYKFLSRTGVHEGKIWWSRMVIPMILYVPVLVSTVAIMYASVMSNKHLNIPLEVFWEGVPLMCVICSAPMVCGAFFSLYVRRQMFAITLTAGFSFLLIFGTLLPLDLFGCSPWWTALPVCLALLAGSRIKAWYWIREQTTRRSRLIPLAPVFGTMLAVVLAFPFVRYFSIPDVSWAQIASALDQADFRETLPPEKRQALLEALEKNRSFPAEFRYEERRYKIYDVWKTSGAVSVTEQLQQQLQANKEYVADEFTLEENILYNYADTYTLLDKSIRRDGDKYSLFTPRYVFMVQTMPWERERMDKILRLHMLSVVVDLGNVQDEQNQSLKNWFVKHADRMSSTEESHLWDYWGEWLNHWCDFCRFRRLNLIFAALNCWHHERGTLPKSLDELVGTYLDALPVDPETGELPVLYVDVPPKTFDYIVAYWGADPFSMGEHGETIRDDAACDAVLRLGQKGYGIRER